jgi:hypothetical protein
VPAPGFDANGHRGTSRSDKLAIAAHLVADEDRLVKHHAIDGYRGTPPSCALRCQTAPGEIHLGEQPSAKDVAVRVRVGRHRYDAHQWQRSRKFHL